MDGGPRKFYHHLADKGPRDVLHEEVVGMAARKVDVEAERQRAGYKDFVLIQLQHVDVQRLAWASFRPVEGDAFDRTGGVHNARCFVGVRGAERVGHFSHCIILRVGHFHCIILCQ